MTAAERGPARPILLSGLPAAVLLHNLEEGLTFARYLPRVVALAPEGFRHRIPAADTMYVVLVVATVIPFALAALARRPSSARWATYALLFVAAILLVNVGWHLLAALVLRGYAPGVVTAVAVNLPVAAGALRSARGDGVMSRRSLWMLLLLAIVVHGPVLIGAVALVATSRARG